MSEHALSDTPIMRRLLEAIADSEHDHPGDDGRLVDLSRRDAVDAAKRITDLRVEVSALAAALYAVSPDHGLLASWEKPDGK